MEEEVEAHKRKLGFSLALCPGHRVIPQTLYNKHHQGGHSDSTDPQMAVTTVEQHTL